MILSAVSLVAILSQFSSANNVPVVYREFSEPPTTNSYIAWIDLGNTPMAADNVAYVSLPEFAIEFYSVGKRDFVMEKKLEDHLTENKIYWRQLPPTTVDGVNSTVYYV